MENCTIFCELFAGINWLWYVVASIAVYAFGAFWHMVLFPKSWARVFKVDPPETYSKSGAFVTMLFQFIATLFLGLGIFMLTPVSVWLALLVLAGFCGWTKGTLKFRYAHWKDYFTAAMIDAGYLFIAGGIFILFALI